jgi:hypothetical protein
MTSFLSRWKCRGVLLSLFLLNGCGNAGQPTWAQQAQLEASQNREAFRSGGKVVQLAQNPEPQPSPLDAQAPVTLVFQTDIYLLSVPFGTYSTNDEFWRRIDEQCVDVATYDLLYQNGLRVGVAGTSELKHFEKFMQGVVPTQRLTVRATELRNVEIEAKKDLPEQTIFVFDPKTETPPGRSYDRCDDIINLSFEPAPRKPGQLRVSLCPMVRAHRKHLEFTAMNRESEYPFVSEEKLYDLNLRADIPIDGFLIVTPSEYVSRRPSTVGRAFFTKDEPTQRCEQVMLIVPHPYRVSEEQANKMTQQK